jgi:DNA-binding transcriptional ArsR family regulator
MDREACVCELMSVFGMAQSRLSHHLIVLREAGFLQDEKRGKWNYYRVNTNSLTPMNRELLLSLSRWLVDAQTIDLDRKSLERVKEEMQICC